MRPGDRLELVERPARVPETASGQLGDGQPDAGGERGEHQGDPVAHPAGGVLVHLRPGDAGQGQGGPRLDHGSGHLGGLRRRQPVEVRGHEERGGLVVGDLASRVAEDEPTEVVLVDRPPIPLGGDHVARVPALPRRRSAGHSPSSPAKLFPANPSAGTPSASPTVAPRSANAVPHPRGRPGRPAHRTPARA